MRNPFRRQPPPAPTTYRITAVSAPTRADLEGTTKPTGPIADLCRDIRENPGEYQSDGNRVRHRQDGTLWINPGAWTSSVSEKHTIAEAGLMGWAMKAVEAYEAAKRSSQSVEGLAKVKAERIKADKHEAAVQQERNAAFPDARRARDVIASCEKRWPEEWAGFVAGLVEQMLPVLEGTHRIVPVEPTVEVTDEERAALWVAPALPWTDRAGKHHRNRAEMRAANRKLRGHHFERLVGRS